MSALMSKASEDGRTLDEAEAKEYDGSETTVRSISEHIVRLQRLDEQNKAAALPVAGNGVDAAAASRNPQKSPVISMRPNVPPATAFIRFCIATMAGKGSRLDALDYAKRRTDWHSSTPEVLQLFDDIPNYAMRAAVPAGTTYDSAWAGPLVVAQNVASEFAEFLRPMTIIGRIPGLRRVPFNISLPRATGGLSAGWVGEAAPKPITAMSFDTLTLRWAKAAAITVLTEELVRFSNPAAEDVVRNDLARGIVQFLDRQFVDPSVAAVTNVSPASITNGITPITPSGVNMAAFRADVRLMFQGLLLANQETSSGVWIMTQQQALALSLAQNSLGQVIYPTMTATGGTLLGYPVVASENLPAAGGSPADGYPLIFVIANEILLADEGQVMVDASREASLQMDSTPDSPPTAATNMLSLWQLNMLGLRAERWITWLRRRSTAVAWITNSHYAE
jgi:HK97 family phage major capsid protein